MFTFRIEDEWPNEQPNEKPTRLTTSNAWMPNTVPDQAPTSNAHHTPRRPPETQQPLLNLHLQKPQPSNPAFIDLKALRLV